MKPMRAEPNLHVSYFMIACAIQFTVTRIVQTKALFDLMWASFQVSFFQALSVAKGDKEGEDVCVNSFLVPILTACEASSSWGEPLCRKSDASFQTSAFRPSAAESYRLDRHSVTSKPSDERACT